MKEINKLLQNTEEILEILRKKDKQGHFVVCSHCNYTWKTSSNKLSLSCPNCNNKTKNLESS